MGVGWWWEKEELGGVVVVVGCCGPSDEAMFLFAVVLSLTAVSYTGRERKETKNKRCPPLLVSSQESNSVPCCGVCEMCVCACV